VYTGAKGKIKVEIAIARGKKQFDKRETIKRREIERRLRQAML
jgi:SsrA-binding protein